MKRKVFKAIGIKDHMENKQETIKRITSDECIAKDLHMTDWLVSAFDGKICKRCMKV